MADKQRRWRRLQGRGFDRRSLTKRMKKAETATTRHTHRFIVRRLDSVRNVQRHIIEWLVLIGVLIAASGVQLVWFQQSYQVIAADSGGTYAEAVLGPVDTLNPLYASSDAEMSAARLMFSSLYSYDTTGHLHGDVAKTMQVDRTGMVYTVSLRPDVHWQDGQLLTAKDVAFTVNLIKNREARAQPALQATWQDVEAKALSDTVVQFKLPAVYAAFPNALTFSILPEHLLASVPAGAIRENTFSRSPVGSGPFTIELLQSTTTKGDRKVIQMTANNNYYQGKPKLSRFELHAYPTSDDIIAALKSGEVNAAQVSPGAASRIDTKVYNAVTEPIDSGVYALFNVNRPAVKDQKVRQALQLATDTTAIRRALGTKVPSLDLPFINGQITGADVPHAPTENDTQAKTLLDEAGWKLVNGSRQKDNQKLALTITTTKDDQYEKVLDVLANQWRRIGVTVTTQVIDRTDPAVNFTRDTLQPRNYDVLLTELQIGADPDVYAYWHSSQIGMTGYNFSNYVNQLADTSLATARSRLEPDLRNAKYKAFARQWLQDVPAIGLYQSVVVSVTNKHTDTTRGTGNLVSLTDRYAGVLDWSVHEKSVYKTP